MKPRKNSIKKIRIEAGMTQAQAARVTHDSLGHYRRLEYGTRFDDAATVALQREVSRRLGRAVTLWELRITRTETPRSTAIETRRRTLAQASMKHRSNCSMDSTATQPPRTPPRKARAAAEPIRSGEITRTNQGWYVSIVCPDGIVRRVGPYRRKADLTMFFLNAWRGIAAESGTR